MPIRYDVDRSLGVVVSRGYGTLEADELVDHFRALANDARLDDGCAEVLDLRSVEDCRLQVPDLLRLVDDALLLTLPLRRCALVCSDQVMLSKFQLFRDFAKALRVEIGVFDQPLSAAAWLDLGPAQLKSAALLTRVARN